MAILSLTGPRLPPQRGAATHLVILLHGYGADGKDLIGLAPHWQRALPGAAFVAPNAPHPCTPQGYQWFAISRLDPSDMRKGVESASQTLDAFIDSELARLDLGAERLALVGFSQGTMMALHVGLARAAKPCVMVGYSGLLAGGENMPPLPGDTPPILLVHGDADAMIPVQTLFGSAGALGRAGAQVQWHISKGVGHGIDPVGLEMGARFLAMGFRGQLTRRSDEISCPLA